MGKSTNVHGGAHRAGPGCIKSLMAPGSARGTHGSFPRLDLSASVGMASAWSNAPMGSLAWRILKRMAVASAREGRILFALCQPSRGSDGDSPFFSPKVTEADWQARRKKSGDDAAVRIGKEAEDTREHWKRVKLERTMSIHHAGVIEGLVSAALRAVTAEAAAGAAARGMESQACAAELAVQAGWREMMLAFAALDAAELGVLHQPGTQALAAALTTATSDCADLRAAQEALCIAATLATAQAGMALDAVHTTSAEVAQALLELSAAAKHSPLAEAVGHLSSGAGGKGDAAAAAAGHNAASLLMDAAEVSSSVSALLPSGTESVSEAVSGKARVSFKKPLAQLRILASEIAKEGDARAAHVQHLGQARGMAAAAEAEARVQPKAAPVLHAHHLLPQASPGAAAAAAVAVGSLNTVEMPAFPGSCGEMPVAAPAAASVPLERMPACGEAAAEVHMRSGEVAAGAMLAPQPTHPATPTHPPSLLALPAATTSAAVAAPSSFSSYFSPPPSFSFPSSSFSFSLPSSAVALPGQRLV